MTNKECEHLINIGFLGLIIGLLIGTAIQANRLIAPIEDSGSYLEQEKSWVTPTEFISEETVSKVLKSGKVSYYTLDGCLGCREDRLTASGEVLDDEKFTLAIPAEWRKDLPMGTMVEVVNTHTGKSVIAKINDTGGFLKYDRIADLSLATCKAIDCKTDSTIIEIKEVNEEL